MSVSFVDIDCTSAHLPKVIRKNLHCYQLFEVLQRVFKTELHQVEIRKLYVTDACTVHECTGDDRTVTQCSKHLGTTPRG